MHSPTKILGNERKHVQLSSTWASSACCPETRKCQGDSTNPYISFYNEIYWKSHSSTLAWYVLFDSWWLVHCDYLFKTWLFMKTVEGPTQVHTAISHRFPSKKINQISLLAHNKKTPLSKRPLTLLEFMKKKEIKGSSKTDSTSFWTNLNVSSTAFYP